MTLMTQSEYANYRGVSAAAVHKAVASGRINLINGKIDPKIADIQWEKNTRAHHVPFMQTESPRIKPLNLHRNVNDHDGTTPQSVYDWQFARAKREHHEANIAEMRDRQRAGELVELQQVHLAYTTLAAQLRAALERIPDKLAPRLAAESDEHAVHALLLAELDQALLDMSQIAERLPAKLQEDAP